VAVAEGVDADRDLVADAALGRVAAAVDRWRRELHMDAMRGRRHLSTLSPLRLA
jgi:hypothetical protein